ncbi:MAG: polysaccharide biosynthesis tyrosine autokinase, partial [Bacillota bacterium]|nr:polysaccharide biosynthesis tyrosine autokinase [Bacillota bacterium]
MNGEENTRSVVSLGRITQILFIGFKRLWWVVLLLAVILGGAMAYHSWSSYVPVYVASETFTVYAKNESQAQITQYNVGYAQQMAKTFPSILKSGMLNELVKADLGTEYLPAISVEALEGVNLIKLSVSGSDPQFCYDALKSVVKNYPAISEYVVGATELKVIDESGIPTAPDNIRDWKDGGKKGVLIGLAAGLLLVVFYGYTKATVMGREDLARTTNARYLGSLPTVNIKRRSAKTVSIDVDRVNDINYKEAFRSLSVRIDRAMKEKGRKTLMVCSAASGEGKTTVAFNLAISLANIHRKVLLIDCDLKNPSLYKMLETEECPGITEIACNGEAYKPLIHKAAGDKIDVLYAGSATTEMFEILTGGNLVELMAELREEYDYILVDTPPCSLLSDAEELAEIMDCALMVVKQNYASRASVIEGLKRINECGLPVIGYILNSYSGR